MGWDGVGRGGKGWEGWGGVRRGGVGRLKDIEPPSGCGIVSIAGQATQQRDKAGQRGGHYFATLLHQQRSQAGACTGRHRPVDRVDPKQWDADYYVITMCLLCDYYVIAM